MLLGYKAICSKPSVSDRVHLQVMSVSRGLTVITTCYMYMEVCIYCMLSVTAWYCLSLK